jgi:hypothetical protein
MGYFDVFFRRCGLHDETARCLLGGAGHRAIEKHLICPRIKNVSKSFGKGVYRLLASGSPALFGTIISTGRKGHRLSEVAMSEVTVWLAKQEQRRAA